MLTGAALAADDDVLAHWTLDEGRGDVAGDCGPNGLDFSLSNCEWVDGKTGKALHLDRQNSFGCCESLRAQGIELTDGACTLSVWIKPDADCSKAELYEILNVHSSEWGPGYRLFYYSGGIWFRSGTGSKDEVSQLRTFSTKAPLVKGEWSMIHVVVDGNDGGRLYINGELAGESAELNVRPPRRAKRRIVLGSFINTDKTERMGFKGSIDELKIVKGAKSHLDVLKEAKQIDF